MKKISVVIPTMWRYAPFKHFLHDLTWCDDIDQIIVIDNDRARRPLDIDTLDVFSQEKLQVHGQEKNIGVNPAWNLGVELSRNEIVCIVNDDISFDFRIFSFVRRYFTNVAQPPLLMNNPGDRVWRQTPILTGNPAIVPFVNTESTFGFGQLFFIEKAEWVPIPDELVIYYGDNWVFDTRRWSPIAMIVDMLQYTPCAQTTKDLPNSKELLESEGLIYEKKIGEFYGRR